MSVRRRFVVLLLSLLVSPLLRAQSSDAEAQYRVARRLAAEGSDAAGAALDRVLQLDPDGPLADDALLDRATLLGIARWPEEVGRLAAVDVAAARRLLTKIVKEYPRADRAREAAYLLGLLGLEPVAGYDAAASRLNFLTLAAGAQQDHWAFAARYSLARAAERSGAFERASDSLQRIRVDAPQTEVAFRAAVALGRIRLRGQRPAEAAASFQQALVGLPDGTAPALRALALRRLAVEALALKVRTGDGLRVATELRPNAVAALPGHGALVADRRRHEVVELDAGGKVVSRWSLEQPVAVVATRYGVRFAVTADAVLRLEPGGATTPLASAASFGAFSDGTVDPFGRIWVLDRRGEQLGRIDPGSTTPVSVWSEKGSKLSGLEWDGERLLTVDIRGHRLLAISADGSARTIAAAGLDRPLAVAADAAGRLAVLEARGAQIRFFDPAGGALGTFAVASAGMQRAVALSFDPSGGLQLIEESSGIWWGAR